MIVADFRFIWILANYQQITGKLNLYYLSAEYQYVILLLISNCVLSANYQQIKFMPIQGYTSYNVSMFQDQAV